MSGKVCPTNLIPGENVYILIFDQDSSLKFSTPELLGALAGARSKSIPDTTLLTPLEPQSRYGDKLLEN